MKKVECRLQSEGLSGGAMLQKDRRNVESRRGCPESTRERKQAREGAGGAEQEGGTHTLTPPFTRQPVRSSEKWANFSRLPVSNPLERR